MIYTFIARACTDLPVSACCRVMRVSTSGFYAWRANPVRSKDLDDAYLSDTIVDIWTMSRRSYGSPRVHAELKLGQDVRCSRKRVERLMRQAGLPASTGAAGAAARGGTHRSSPPTTWSSGPSIPPSPTASGSWTSPSTRPRTARPTWPSSSTPSAAASWAGRSPITCALSSSSTPSRWPSGAAGHPLVRRSPTRDHGSTYTSWAFGRRLRGNGLLGSMGSIGDCFDNSVAESFFGTLQLELLDEHHWESRQQLAQAIFEWIEAWYNPRRRHSYCQMLSPVDYEAAHAA